MNRGISVFFFLACASATAAEPWVIYGEDDRRDLYEVSDPIALKAAESTVALFLESRLRVDRKKGVVRLDRWYRSTPFCPEARFADQTQGAFCSGALVGEDLVLTAAHCVPADGGCRDFRIVFGYAIREEGKLPHELSAGEVYGCAEVVFRKKEGKRGSDIALLRLDRKVTNHPPLPIRREGAIEADAPLFMIGHPAGLPAKVAGNAKVLQAGARIAGRSYPSFFTADLDTFHGNSGSPVFDARTGVIEGVAVRGEPKKYLWRDSPTGVYNRCAVPRVCEPNGCAGEDVNRLDEVLALIP